jgi:GH24 family phage-related lysozyme (muramidase)
MKIRITKKGLPKAQWQNSQIPGGQAINPRKVAGKENLTSWNVFDNAPQQGVPTQFIDPQSVVNTERNVWNYSPYRNSQGESITGDEYYNQFWTPPNTPAKTAPNINKKSTYKKTNNFNDYFAAGAMTLNALDNRQTDKELEASWRNGLISPGIIDYSQNRGDYEMNTGMVDPYNTGAKNKGQFTNSFYTSQFQEGGIFTLNEVQQAILPNMLSVAYERNTPASTYVNPPNNSLKIDYTDAADFIKSQEGFIPKAKWDYAQYSVGYGTKAKNKNEVISKEEAENRLKLELAPVMEKIQSKLKVPINSGQLIALASINYNTGSLANKLIDRINKGESPDIIANTIKSMALTGVGSNKILPGLVKRRNEEAGLFLRGYENGGENTEIMKIRITNSPEKMEYGGQSNYALDLGRKNMYTDMPTSPYESVSKTIQEVPEEFATIEAEKGETILTDVDGDGIREHMNIEGKYHEYGGTNLAANPGDFVFSNHKPKMAIKDPTVLKLFDKKFKKGGYTPAEIAKQYDLNKYKAVLENKDADKYDKNTAELMSNNINKKLGMLSFVQEAIKGFPQGIPEVAKSTMGQNNQVAYGGYIPEMAYGGYLEQYQDKGQVTPSWLKPWLKSNTQKGRTSPTGKMTTYNPDVDNIYKELDYWQKRAGRNFKSADDMQSFIYSSIEKEDPSIIEDMWKKWGNTAKSKNTDLANFADNTIGARTADLLNTYRTKRGQPVSIPRNVKSNFNLPPLNTNSIDLPLTVPNPFTPPSDKVPDFNESKGNTPYGWTNPDKRNLANALINRSYIKKYPSVRSDVNPAMSDFRNMDWRGKAAELQGTYNSQLNTLGNFQSPTSLAANMSFMAGQQGENLVNRAIEPTEQQNVNIYNQVAGQNANIMNNALANAAQNKFLRSGERAAVNQRYNQEMIDFNNAYTQARNQGENNAAGIYNTNVTESPYYYIDPATQRMKFNSDNARAAFEAARRSAGPSDNDVVAKYLQIRSSLTGVPDDEKDDVTRAIMGLDKSARGRMSQTTFPFDQIRNRTTVQQPVTGNYSQNPNG